MKLLPIIQSLLDSDLYKFNMQQVMLHKHPDLIGEYWFKCRNKDVKFTKEMFDEINDQIDSLCELRFRKSELDFLRTVRYLKHDYIEFLRFWHPMRDYVTTNLTEEGELIVKIKGPIAYCMPFEIYLLEIINEVYFRFSYNYNDLVLSAEQKLTDKINSFNTGVYNFKFAEFGCRRRLSREWQDRMVGRLVNELENHNCVGTSNVYLAFKYNITPIGTYAHEYVEMYEGITKYPVAYANYYAMKDWYDEYKGDNGTALTDTLTTDIFLLDFGRSMAATYNGVRHDSGDPYSWGEKMIKHYESLGIDPKTKTLLFSDSLNGDKAQKLYDHFKDKIKVSFGIGTYFSNDTNVNPLNIVIKLQYVNDNPVAKISDCEGKTMCPDLEFTKYLKSAIDLRLKRENNKNKIV